jgi:general secretion pathway protein L
MKHTVFVRLPLEVGGEAAWWDPGKNTGGNGTLAELAPVLSRKPLIVLAPGVDVVIHWVRRPHKISRQKWQQALPFILEDLFVAPVETLHFALGRPTPEGDIPVAVVARATMDQWIAELKAVGLRPRALIPESLMAPLPEEGNHWTLFLAPDSALVRIASTLGFAVDFSTVRMALERALLAFPDHTPETILVINGSCGYWSEEAPIVFPTEGPLQIMASWLPPPEEVEQGEIFWLSALIRGYRPALAINLFQGGYRVSEQWQSGWMRHARRFRLAAILLVGWMGLVMGQRYADVAALNRHATALDERLRVVYQETFPEAKRIVSPKIQMERQLKEMRQGDGAATGFLPLLGVVAEGMRPSDEVVWQRVRYQNGRMDVQIRVKSYGQLDAFKKWLTGKGLNMAVQSATQKEEGVESLLRITAQ